MMEFLTGFHFLRPLWLTVIPLILIWAAWSSSRQRQAGWARHIARDKLAHLLIGESKTLPKPLLAIPMIAACLALAGPAWQSLPANVASSQDVRVFVLDLSPSMLARDNAPDRLTKARLKLIDMLRLRQGAESALIVYAGDAHQVTPLTDDPATIETLVPTLHPDIMPIAGNQPEQAIMMASGVIESANYNQGDIVLITDGMPSDAIATIKATLPASMTLSILGMGTPRGAPIPTESGYLVDESQNIIMASLNTQELEQLVRHFKGRYVTTTDSTSDVEYLNALPKRLASRRSTEQSQRFDQHNDGGYWLVLLLLPIAILGYRKNLIWIGLPLLVIAPDSHALDWQSFWLNSDQRAARALAQGDTERAAELFRDERWRSVAHYRAGNYLQSVELLAGAQYANDFYNLGNAQALAGDLEAALKSYDLALLLYRDHETDAIADTVHNMAVVRKHFDQQNDDESDSGQADDDEVAAASEPTQSTDDEQSAAGSARQSAVGGVTGGDDSLDQQSLSDQGSNEQNTNEPTDTDDPLPDDASIAAADSPATAEDGDGDRQQASSSDEMPIETNSGNKVLTPYSEQWLRELPLDPGGYLRRKFFYESSTTATTASELKNSDKPTQSSGRY